ncbi:major capsid protein, partial [Clavibacter michiganensis]
MGRLLPISPPPVISFDSFYMDAFFALRLSPFRRVLSIDSPLDIFPFYVPPRHVSFEQFLPFMPSCVNSPPLPPFNTPFYIDPSAFLGTLPPDTPPIPPPLFHFSLNISPNYFPSPCLPDR